MDLANLNLPVGAQTLEETITMIEKNARLAATVRRDLVSDIQAVARLIGRHPSEVSTSIPSLRAELRKVAPGASGVAAKRFTNVRSSLARALRLVRVLPRQRPRAEPTPGWQALWDRIDARHTKARLSRLIEYCSHRCIEPSEISDSTLQRFQAHLDATSLYADPKKITDDAARALNRVSETLGLNLTALTVSKTGRYTTRPLDA